jgi:hypothetical protein
MAHLIWPEFFAFRFTLSSQPVLSHQYRHSIARIARTKIERQGICHLGQGNSQRARD